jgi:hypothetical protein
MSGTETTGETQAPRKSSRFRTNGYALAVFLALGAALLVAYGPRLWRGFQDYRLAREAADNTTPIGYPGVFLRRTYNDKPAQFLTEKDGRRLLWAAKGDDGQPIFYDVTDAAIRLESLCGGFGRDSIPGIDYPILDRPDSPRASRLRGPQRLYGVNLQGEPHAYPAELLKKIEVVNDRDGSTPFVVVFDRKTDSAGFYDRKLDGQEVTFGTTGYAFGETPDPSVGTPILYDRKSKSLWVPQRDALACINGPHKGTKLPKFDHPEDTTWSDWRGKHPGTLVIMGNDREKPIPTE